MPLNWVLITLIGSQVSYGKWKDFEENRWIETHLSEWKESLIPRSTQASELLQQTEIGQIGQFCKEWNPDFNSKKPACCAPVRSRNKCSLKRAKRSFCDEMTEDQKDYVASVQTGRTDVLEDIRSQSSVLPAQAYCSPSTGFLAYGRPLISTHENGLKLRRADRCTQFGTDPMIGMLEFLGRTLQQEESLAFEKSIIVGDISAPRGGCLRGAGRRGHRSHTNGRDVDLGFLYKKGKLFDQFTKHFDPELNWFLLKKIFSNPFACIELVFLDRKHILSLEKIAGGDKEWQDIRSKLQHVKFHKNHFHIRISELTPAEGCFESDAVSGESSLEGIDD